MTKDGLQQLQRGFLFGGDGAKQTVQEGNWRAFAFCKSH
jgi:hypothetical protein